MLRLLVVTLLFCAVLPSAVADAVPAAGMTPSRHLVLFDTSSPGVFQYWPIKGFGTDERVVAMAGRPENGRLYVLTAYDPAGDAADDVLHLYTVDPVTRMATQVGAPVAGVAGFDDARYGMDFNAAVDRIRVVNTADQNFRLNPDTGALAGMDAPLTNVSDSETLTAIAYDRPLPPATGTTGTTTLFGLDYGVNDLVMIGGPDGTPSANGGAVTKIGDLPLVAFSSLTENLDIDSSGTAWATITTAGGGDRLYRADLANGGLTDAGELLEGLSAFTIRPPVPLHFDAATVTVPEGAGSVQLRLSRLGSVTAINAGYSTAPGSAGGGDFGSRSGTVAFGAGDTAAKTITIPVTQDSIDEPDETFAVKLSRSDGTPVLAPNSVTVTITDDDEPPATGGGTPTGGTSTPVVDVTKPAATLRAASSIRLATLLRRGLPVTFSCDEPCSGRVQLRIGKRVLASKTLARAAGTRSARLRLSRRRRAELGRLMRGRGSRSARLSATFTDAAGNASARSRSLRIKR